MPCVHGLRLVIAVHQPAFRQKFVRLLHSAGFSILAQCDVAADAVRLADRHWVDVVLLDLGMPECSGFEAVRQLNDRRPPVRTLGISTPGDRAAIPHGLRLGARGVIQRDCPGAVLIDAVRTVANGGYWVAPDDLAVLIEALRTNVPGGVSRQTQSSVARQRFHLTRREMEIVASITMGASNKEIAEQLALKECTVKHHVASVFDKVGVLSRLQLALFAIHNHLVNVAEFLP